MGHWPSALPIPWTDSYLAIPLAGAAHAGGEEHDHSQHCHGGSANCSDAPAAAGVSVALGTNALLVGFAGGMLFFAVAAAWRPARLRTPAPDLRPPEWRAFAC